jgi:hypothetical protein
VDVRWHARLEALRQAINNLGAANPSLSARLIPHAIQLGVMARREASRADTADILNAVLPVAQEANNRDLWQEFIALFEFFMSMNSL